MRRWHARRTADEKRETRRKQKESGSAAMVLWHLERTDEERESTREKQRAAAICQALIPRQATAGSFKKGHADVLTADGIERSRERRKMGRIVTEILKDIATNDPLLIREAIIRGLMADPPKSLGYVIIAAHYLDGKPRDAEPEIKEVAELSSLSYEELAARAEEIAQRLRNQVGQPKVIDLLPVRCESEGP